MDDNSRLPTVLFGDSCSNALAAAVVVGDKVSIREKPKLSPDLILSALDPSKSSINVIPIIDGQMSILLHHKGKTLLYIGKDRFRWMMLILDVSHDISGRDKTPGSLSSLVGPQECLLAARGLLVIVQALAMLAAGVVAWLLVIGSWPLEMFFSGLLFSTPITNVVVVAGSIGIASLLWLLLLVFISFDL
ncbi:LOW QUALITY PROTEIN: hypothetical protein NC652_034721 [Populus alba x Populus x berolinensis]|nr:LOW QUALITY PROTEIN: hypothetical protein NC652_034721 [Populus alba x Populus x berolinensis]